VCPLQRLFALAHAWLLHLCAAEFLRPAVELLASLARCQLPAAAMVVASGGGMLWQESRHKQLSLLSLLCADGFVSVAVRVNAYLLLLGAALRLPLLLPPVQQRLQRLPASVQQEIDRRSALCLLVYELAAFLLLAYRFSSLPLVIRWAPLLLNPPPLSLATHYFCYAVLAMHALAFATVVGITIGLAARSKTWKKIANKEVTDTLTTAERKKEETLFPLVR
jgi:hypothetical protein